MLLKAFIGIPILCMLAAPVRMARAAETIVVAVEEVPYLPYHSFETGHFSGFAERILSDWARSRGAGVVFESTSVKRKVEALTQPGIDLVWPDNPTWRVVEKTALGRPVRYSTVLISGLQGVLVRRDAGIKGLAEIKAVGTIGGFTNELGRLGVGMAGRQTIETRTVASLIEMLADNRVDAIYCDQHAAEHELHRVNSNLALDFAPGSPRTANPFQLSTVARPDLVADFDRWLAANGAKVAHMTSEALAEHGAT